MPKTPRTTRRTNNPRAAKRAADLRAFNEAEAQRAAEVEQPVTDWVQPADDIPPVVVPPEALDEQPIVVTEGDLATSAHRINGFFAVIKRGEERLADSQLALAIELANAKSMCANAKMNFRRWAEGHLDRTRSWQMIRKLARVGEAENPQLALEDWRAGNRKANQRRDEQRRLASPRDNAVRMPEQTTYTANAGGEPPVIQEEEQPEQMTHYDVADQISHLLKIVTNEEDQLWVITSTLRSADRDLARRAVEKVFGEGSLAA